jgi:hypothetical protein
MGTPSIPFEVIYKTARVGDVQIPAQWAVPYDHEFRPIEIPNGPEASHMAYASIGWHVCSNPFRYVPAYKIEATFNYAINPTSDSIRKWEERVGEELTITNRSTGVTSLLLHAVSRFEAAVSWFMREPSHEGFVLCFDRKDHLWYIEPKRQDLIVAITDMGVEVPVDEPHVIQAYLIENHANAVVSYGE